MSAHNGTPPYRCTLPEASLRSLGSVTRILIGVAARDAGEARARWKSLFGVVDRERVQAQVAGWPEFLVMATGSRTGGETIPYGVWKLDGSAPGAATGGPTPRRKTPAAAPEPGSRAA